MTSPSGDGGADGNGHGKVKKKNARGNGKHQQKPNCDGNRNPAVKQPKFVGRCEDLAGFIFDCSSAQGPNTFIKSKQELAEYGGRNCKCTAEVRVAIETLQPATVPRPDDPDEDASQWDHRIWDKMVDAWIKASMQLDQDMQRMYSVAMGQCTEALRAKLESKDEFEAVSWASDVIRLLRMIGDISFNFQSQKYDVLALMEAEKHFFGYRQGKYITVPNYMEELISRRDVVEHCGGKVGYNPGLITRVLTDMGTNQEDGTKEQLERATATAKEEYMAMLFLMNSDKVRFQGLLRNLENGFLKGTDEYPKTLNAAYTLLMNWRLEQEAAMVGGSGDLAFANVGEDEGGDSGGDDTDAMTQTTQGRPGDQGTSDKSRVKCYCCHKMGHYAYECPEKGSDEKSGAKKDVDEEKETKTGTQLLMAAMDTGDLDGYESDFIFHQRGVVRNTVTYKDALMRTEQVEMSLSVRSANKTKGTLWKAKPRPDSQVEKHSSTRSKKRVSYSLVASRKVKSVKSSDSVNVQHVLNQNHGKKVNPNWILLDNQSTVDLFYNLNFW